MPDQQFPEPAVGALIFNPEGKVFLMKSHKWKDHYIIPGGHIELGETMHEALKREIKEETNLDIFDIQFIIFQEFINDPLFWKKRHFLFFDFSCKTRSSDVQLDAEGQEYVWVSLPEALQLPIDPYTRRTIEVYLANKEKQKGAKGL